MRLVRALFVAALVPVLAAPGPPPAGAVRFREGDNVAAKIAEMRLTQGMSLAAAQIAKACLDEDPSALQCAEIRARALASAGRCDAALPALDELRADGHWSVALAVSEGSCLQRMGQPEAAMEAFGEALDLKGHLRSLWLHRALLAARIGRLDVLEADIAGAEEAEEADRWVLDVLRAHLALERGDADADWRLWMLDREVEQEARDAVIQVAVLDCERWLDLDAPEQARDAATLRMGIGRGHVRLGICLAEAVRRSGDLVDAEHLTDRIFDRHRATPLMDLMRVRVLVDLGRLDEAEALLAETPDPLAAEALASAWYVARARGRADEAAHLAALYRIRETRPERRLELLVPPVETP